MVPGYFSLEIQAMQLKGFTPKWLHQQCIYIVILLLVYLSTEYFVFPKKSGLEPNNMIKLFPAAVAILDFHPHKK
jgi:hypothetical protein